MQSPHEHDFFAEITALFYRGRYQCVLSSTIDKMQSQLSLETLPFVLGSLVFRGRLDEADTLYTLHFKDLQPDSQVICLFYLGIGHCRNSNYDRARSIFARNLRRFGGSENPISRFYAWQGSGFYRLFCGRYRKGYEAAQKAYAAAIEGNFIYGKTLASDLAAHNQILPGEISKALRNFDLASGFASALGDGGIQQALEISRAIHSAQFGLNVHDGLNQLQKLLVLCKDEDNYSRSRLHLEIGRQQTLMGNASAAWESLNSACRLIYGSDNRRYQIILNLRYAYLNHLKGESEQALNLVRNANKELDRKTDTSLEFEVLGLEKLIISVMDKDSFGQEKIHSRFDTLKMGQRRSGKAINLRILARESGEHIINSHPGDDPLGDLLDLIVLDPQQAAQRIVEAKYLGLFYKLIPQARGRRMLYFDFIPGSILIFDRGNVIYVANHQSSVIRAIAKELLQGPTSKEDLIARIWGYNYQPIKHDSLIYRNVSRFRSLLGERADWIQADEQGYHLNAGVQVVFHVHHFENKTASVQSSSLDPDEMSDETLQELPSVSGQLNFRQMEILRLFSNHDYIDVKLCSERFGVSEITSRRDLSQLTSIGLLLRSGKGRATKYSLQDKNN